MPPRLSSPTIAGLRRGSLRSPTPVASPRVNPTRNCRWLPEALKLLHRQCAEVHLDADRVRHTLRERRGEGSFDWSSAEDKTVHRSDSSRPRVSPERRTRGTGSEGDTTEASGVGAPRYRTAGTGRRTSEGSRSRERGCGAVARVA